MNEIVRSKSAQTASAYHEAGHAVIAYMFGYKPQAATIIPTIDTAGSVSHPNPLRGIRLDIDGSDRARLRVEKAIIICLAGPLAQRHHNRRSWRSYHGQSDYELINELALRICGSAEQASAFLKWLEIVAHDLVKMHWRQITKVAMALLERTRLSADELRVTIVGHADGIITIEK